MRARARTMVIRGETGSRSALAGSMISELMLLKSWEKLACFNWSTTVLNKRPLAFDIGTEVRLVDQGDLDRPRLFLDLGEPLGQLHFDRLDRFQALLDRPEQVGDLDALERAPRVSAPLLDPGDLFLKLLDLCVLGAVTLGQLLLLLDQMPDVVGCAELRGARAQIGDQAGRIAAELTDRVRDRPERTPLAGEFLSELELVPEIQGLIMRLVKSSDPIARGVAPGTYGPSRWRREPSISCGTRGIPLPFSEVHPSVGSGHSR